MKFNEYQKKAYETLINKDRDNLVYFTMGVAGEAGEVVDKIKKVIRDADGVLSDEDKKEVAKEMGDVLWYLSQLSGYMGYDFADIAQINLDKLKDRQKRGALAGSGDNR